MIKSFAHKGLETFFTTGSKKGIQPQHAKKLDLILRALHTAKKAGDMDFPGFAFKPLKNWGENLYSVRVDGNYRVTFDFIGTDAERVNYEDYH
ncbi:MAG: type II toxin-antitoxin system RelE/ParE family toxin [Terriglobus sp.]